MESQVGLLGMRGGVSQAGKVNLLCFGVGYCLVFA